MSMVTPWHGTAPTHAAVREKSGAAKAAPVRDEGVEELKHWNARAFHTAQT
jgi:hypothetical protein